MDGVTVYGTLGIEAGVVKEDYFYTNNNAIQLKSTLFLFEVCLVEDETLEAYLTYTGTDLRTTTAAASAEVRIDNEPVVVSGIDKDIDFDGELRATSAALFFRQNATEETTYAMVASGSVGTSRKDEFPAKAILSGYKVYKNPDSNSGVVLDEDLPECE